MAPLTAPPTQRVLPQEQPEIVPPAAPTVEAPEAPPAGPPVQVDRVQVEGVTVYDEATLRGLYGDVVGRRRTARPARPRWFRRCRPGIARTATS